MKQKTRTIYACDDRPAWRRVWHIYDANPDKPESIWKGARCGRYISAFDLIGTSPPLHQICKSCMKAKIAGKFYQLKF